jgi:NADP-dependent 3-hydroxy acid dehydrogenase YdfG
VIYGAGGATGGAVARAFADEGAKLLLSGRRLAQVEAVAKDIVAVGGFAEAAEVDALDEQAVDWHLRSVIDKAGHVDISFNAVGIPDSTLVGCAAGRAGGRAVLLPITAYTTSYFLTARVAARRMVPNESGVIVTVTAIPARTGTPLNGRAATARRRPPRRHSLEPCPPSLHLRALAWSVCDQAASRRQTRSRKSSRQRRRA